MEPTVGIETGASPHTGSVSDQDVSNSLSSCREQPGLLPPSIPVAKPVSKGRQSLFLYCVELKLENNYRQTDLAKTISSMAATMKRPNIGNLSPNLSEENWPPQYIAGFIGTRFATPRTNEGDGVEDEHSHNQMDRFRFGAAGEHSFGVGSRTISNYAADGQSPRIGDAEFCRVAP
jgi:hypothetical protein